MRSARRSGLSVPVSVRGLRSLMTTPEVLGIAVLLALYFAMGAAVVLIARAALALRAAVGARYTFRTLVLLAAGAVVGRTLLGSDRDIFERFGRRVRVALCMLGLPLVFSSVLRFL